MGIHCTLTGSLIEDPSGRSWFWIPHWGSFSKVPHSKDLPQKIVFYILTNGGQKGSQIHHVYCSSVWNEIFIWKESRGSFIQFEEYPWPWIIYSSSSWMRYTVRQLGFRAIRAASRLCDLRRWTCFTPDSHFHLFKKKWSDSYSLKLSYTWTALLLTGCPLQRPACRIISSIKSAEWSPAENTIAKNWWASSARSSKSTV